jgi:hypothetical protein
MPAGWCTVTLADTLCGALNDAACHQVLDVPDETVLIRLRDRVGGWSREAQVSPKRLETARC